MSEEIKQIKRRCIAVTIFYSIIAAMICYAAIWDNHEPVEVFFVMIVSNILGICTTNCKWRSDLEIEKLEQMK